ncbi:hypothetical protein [Marinobacter flavimaris]|uniref:hypothetical protein n=1 Tax=Marinobacter flavimaris TaxID=262076 RepID=UPI0038688C0F
MLLKLLTALLVFTVVWAPDGLAASLDDEYYILFEVQNVKPNGKKWDPVGGPDFVVFPGGKGNAAAGRCTNLISDTCSIKARGPIPAEFYIHEVDEWLSDPVGTASGNCTLENPCDIKSAKDPDIVVGFLYVARDDKPFTVSVIEKLKMKRDMLKLSATSELALRTKSPSAIMSLVGQASQFVSDWTGSRAADCIAKGLGVATGELEFLVEATPDTAGNIFGTLNLIKSDNMALIDVQCRLGNYDEAKCSALREKWSCSNDSCDNIRNKSLAIGQKLINHIELGELSVFKGTCANLDSAGS